MPWGWSQSTTKSIDLGGKRGSVHDAKQPTTWPQYEQEYLLKRVKNLRESAALMQPFETPTEELTYLQKASHGYKTEAEEELHNEFVKWLQGSHPDNYAPTTYTNGPGKPRRRHVFDGVVGDEKTNWVPTHWGKTQLTHIPGVREFLRKMSIESDENDLQMNLLAEFGPQNLEQAWMYFKHWVKARPLTKGKTLMGTPDDVLDTGEIGQRSNVTNQIPDNFNNPSVEFKEASVRAARENEDEINQVIEQLIQDVEKRQTVSGTVQGIFDRVLENARNADRAEQERLEKSRDDKQVSRLTRSLVAEFNNNLNTLVQQKKEEQRLASSRRGLRSDKSSMSPNKAKAMGRAIMLELMLNKMKPAQRAALLEASILEIEEVLQGPEITSTDFSFDEMKLEKLKRLQSITPITL
eukprot:4000022-Pleurochrysis_carterae.AAC.1